MLTRHRRVLAIAVMLYLGPGRIEEVFSQEIVHNQSWPEPRTAKERLGNKSSDEQRVDNCKVPVQLRGPTPRPDRCSGNVGTTLKR
jgi:hypothetical protein